MTTKGSITIEEVLAMYVGESPVSRLYLGETDITPFPTSAYDYSQDLIAYVAGISLEA